ncbi:cell division protein ZapA [Szabonella alba]|uniref:Cell division protein ZapA n=1 Tax=Szabonella alba TaxID=2804194 RepID=A0A8K0VDQ5_9RHOB|nr:cell division protein ZapA [Szabonella alba]MBL4917819.1 cell division protein ZapA [Szabonella alba]
MAELEITIGNKSFSVACQEGEEHFLCTAAAMLDAEAQPLVTQMGRLPEARLLLMAGLMLADRTAAVEDELRVLRARVAELETQPAPAPQRVEVPVIPPQMAENLAEIAARTEALAAEIEEKSAALAAS